MKKVMKKNTMKLFLLFLAIVITRNFCFGWEIITNEFAPYSFEEANWRSGNYIQCLVNSDYNFVSLSENRVGLGVVEAYRWPDGTYGCDTGRALTCFTDEAMFTPVVRLDLIKRLVQGLQAAQFPNAPAVYFPWNATKGQSTFFRPCASSAVQYPATRLIVHTFTDTTPLANVIVWPRINISGTWYDDSDYSYNTTQLNVHNGGDGSYTTQGNYTSGSLPSITITGKGWAGDRDKMLEMVISSAANVNRQGLQLVLSNFSDPGMGFAAPYPTELPETIQLPDKTEVMSTQWTVTNPSYQYIIIYTKDADNSSFDYQNAMLFMWQGHPSSVTVDWQSGWQSDAYRTVHIEYSGTSVTSEKVWVARFKGIDPSAGLGHIHKIANNVFNTGVCGYGLWNPFEICWAEEPVSGVAGGAYILCKYDAEEDQFGGDYADTARQLASQLVEDRIAMWSRGRHSTSYAGVFLTYQYVSGAYYLSLLYDLPGRFYDPVKRDYYYGWMCTWADYIVSHGYTDGRNMTGLWRAYERSGNSDYLNYFQSLRSRYTFSATDGIHFDGVWQPVRKQYENGDVLGALGRRGTAQDKTDIENVLTFITNEDRWTDNGYVGYWWEVTPDASITAWGEWTKALGMQNAPKQIVSISDFPIYYKDGNDVVVKISHTPNLYNPKYWDQQVMNNYLPLLPHKLCKSIQFRIDNILLKTDFYNNWWVGTSVPAAINDLNAIKTKTQAVLAYIDGPANSYDYNAAMNLLLQCDALYSSANNSTIKSDLKGEISWCLKNHEYLKNVLPVVETLSESRDSSEDVHSSGLGLVGDVSGSSGRAVNVNWTGGGVGNLWSTPENWLGDTLPMSADFALLGLADANTLIDSTVTANVYYVNVANENNSTTLTMTGGTFDLGFAGLRIGYGGGAKPIGGIMNLSGGVVTTQNAYVGHNGVGTLNMTGGKINVTAPEGGTGSLIIPLDEQYGGSGHIRLDGGTIDTVNLKMRDAGTIDITGGTLILTNPFLGVSNIDTVTTVENLVANNRITAFYGTGAVVVDPDINPGRITVTASPPRAPWAGD